MGIGAQAELDGIDVKSFRAANYLLDPVDAEYLGCHANDRSDQYSFHL